MRGKQNLLTATYSENRITPAGAGKTHCSHSFAPKSEDHPRGCGENNSKSVATSFVAGSPPRMRGKHAWELPIYPTDRITPADAGKTRPARIFCCWGRDHPRGCGENLPIPDKRLGTLGSPPRMRGKHIFHWYSGICARITPADAGKTSIIEVLCSVIWDHPRRCGENY